MRALIYSRFSTDKQRETSVADQIRVCTSRAAAEGMTVVGQYRDEGVSGSVPVAARPGGSHLLADALADRFDVLIVEGLDRLSRDQVEQERIVRRLEHRGLRIVGVADGYDSQMGARKIMRGVRGMINELYLDDLRHKTHRGQSGQFERGFIAGGASYGYDIEKTDAGSRYVVNNTEAQWVRWIYTKFITDGWSVQKIAHELNARNVASPRGGSWAVSALYGCPNKGSGILNNELYAGRLIWNRSQWLKDPDTGKRQRVERPRDEWKVAEVPELRIVSDDLWTAARHYIDTKRAKPGKGRGRPTRTLLGGLMRCPHCGGSVVAIDKRFYGCTARHDRGPAVCAGIRFPRDKADVRLLGDLRDELLSPATQRDLERRLRAALQERGRAHRDTGAEIRKRREALDAEIGRLVDALAQVGSSDAIVARLRAAEAEKKKLVALPVPIAAKEEPADKIVARFKKKMMDLKAELEGDVERARKIVAQLFGEIRIVADGEQIFAEYESAAQRLLIASGGTPTNSVAGTGFVICRRRVLLHTRG